MQIFSWYGVKTSNMDRIVIKSEFFMVGRPMKGLGKSKDESVKSYSYIADS